MTEELKRYIRWERASNVVKRNGYDIGISEIFRQFMEEGAEQFISAVPEGFSPHDGSLGHYGLLMEGYSIGAPEKGMYEIVPTEFIGVVCHRRATPQGVDKARKTARELGLEYKGKTF